VAGGDHEHAANNLPGLGIGLTLAADNVHAHAADGPLALTATHILAVADSYHVHDGEGALVIVMSGSIGLNFAAHAVVSDNLDLTGTNVLAAADSYHGISDDGPLALTQEHALSIIDGGAVHGHFVDAIEIPVLPADIVETWVESATTVRLIHSATTITIIESYDLFRRVA
jgi:hypothetical protein